MKLPAYGSRSQFKVNLRKAGLKEGQIRHVETLYNQGKSREAAAYMRRLGVTPYRRRTTKLIRQHSEDLRTRAIDAKKRKLGRSGSIPDIMRATEQELEQLIDLTPEELKGLASNQRPHNPFWYHSNVSYTERVLKERAA